MAEKDIKNPSSLRPFFVRSRDIQFSPKRDPEEEKEHQ